eukprot:CAMPEP_0202962034 /NCGR_PEP_ID=MMETSP1396-20130829/6135_1 /ASSEMBLY_ACC=CAM_ASM_000872 /TAXON_ID= /ORGANISM="Pseudokeronopsis sp., Strain Brazil" /LENGTH=68 /DNA_ID=CAMNT_0049682329 /DNA_START=1377 /DNA_END=1583 /DNA_ORIENTATION=-
MVVCFIALASNIPPYFFDFRESRSMDPKKKQAIKIMFNKEVEELTERDVQFDRDSIKDFSDLFQRTDS